MMREIIAPAVFALNCVGFVLFFVLWLDERKTKARGAWFTALVWILNLFAIADSIRTVLEQVSA